MWFRRGLWLMLACSVFQSKPAAAFDKINFTDSWSWAGFTAYFLLAEKSGYYAENGLKVILNRGFGSGKVPGDLAAGTFEIGSGDINPVIVFNAKNAERKVRVIALIDDTSPLVAVARKDGSIKTPRDFEGKTLAAPPFDAGRQFFHLFAEAAGFDASKVKWLSVDGTLREAIMARGHADGITGFTTSAIVNLEKLGFPRSKLSVFPYHEYGVNLYGRGIMVSEEYLRKNPEVVRRFLRATFRAMKDMLRDPAAGLAALKEKEPLVDLDVEAKQWALQRELIVSENTTKNGLSFIDRDRMQKAIHLVERAMSLPSEQSVEDLYTEAYLPERKELQIAP